MASYSSIHAQLALTAMTAVFLLSSYVEASSADISLKIWKMQLAINNTKGYSAFQPYFYASTAPLEIFNIMDSGKKVTVLVPSDKVMNAIPDSIKSVNTTFGNVVLFNSLYGSMSIHDLQRAVFGKVWKSLYNSREWKKVSADNRYKYGLSVAGSTTPTSVMGVLKGNLNRDRSIYCHGVDYYFIPNDL